MKKENKEIEQYRVTEEKARRRGLPRRLASDLSYGNNGAFWIPSDVSGRVALQVTASDGNGWDHVSVTVLKKKRCPTWEEMNYVKGIFWADDEVVIQFHPSRDQYVNNHEYCLHMWKPQNFYVVTPPPIMVGYKS